MSTASSLDRPPFNLCAGHPALDLVNSLDNRFRADGTTELLSDYADLVRFTAQSGLLRATEQRSLAKASPAAAARALRSARQLREAAASVLYAIVGGGGPEPADLARLGQQFWGASRHRELCWDPGSRPGNGSISWRWNLSRGDAQLPVWLLANSAQDLLLSGQLERVSACGVETCRWLFLDTSKNRTRRWCDMSLCGNRMKARRYLARRDEAR